MPPAPKLPQAGLDLIVTGLLLPQLERLGLEPGRVPADGATCSGRSRGYVYGMACGVAGRMTDSSNQIVATAEAAFAYVWGPEHAGDALATLECGREGDREIVGAIHRGTADVEALLDGKPGAEVIGFWLLNNGEHDPAEVIPPYRIPGPIPVTA